MKESTKSAARRKAEGFYDKYLTGTGIDIGCGSDPITESCRAWDLADGDAQKLEGVLDCSYDYVYSSHCLEHMRDPLEALGSWWRVLKPGGYLIVIVPDEDLYEQGIWPSVFNPDHKWTYSISKEAGRSWSPRHKDLVELVKGLGEHRIEYIRTMDEGYDRSRCGVGPIIDQTDGPAEAAIEMVVKKLGAADELCLKSQLRAYILCPTCQDMGLTIQGYTKENKVAVVCYKCGVTGQLFGEAFETQPQPTKEANG